MRIRLISLQVLAGGMALAIVAGCAETRTPRELTDRHQEEETVEDDGDCEEPEELVPEGEDLEGAVAIEWPDPVYNSHSGEEAMLGSLDAPSMGRVAVLQRLDEEDLVTEDGKTYAQLSLEGATVRIQNDDSPAVPVGAAPEEDLLLGVGPTPLLDVGILLSYSVRNPGPDATVTLGTVSLFNHQTGEPLTNPASVPGQTVSSGSCAALAIAQFGSIPAGMPPVTFPKVVGCSFAHCVDALHAWLRAHHHVWRARQLLAAVNAMHPESRNYFWDKPGIDADGAEVVDHSRPSHWYGAYDNERFAAIRQVHNKLWSMLTTNYTNNTKIELRCPSSSANVCFTASPSAHHFVKGTVDLCPKFFERVPWQQGRLIAHELLHHRFVNWTLNGSPRHDPIMDTHTHGHGTLCTSNVTTVKHYGMQKVRHLATYENANGGHCFHRNFAFRNNDTNAYFATTIGELVLTGEYFDDNGDGASTKKMVSWPVPTDPTPKPPECDFGTEGCQCLPTQDHGEDSFPDGDYSIDRYCPDHDGELSCVETAFNASDIVGICTRCSITRGPGCTCNSGLPCDVGTCYGEDTHGGGGMGRCYKSPPPEWACLADCARLFNDDEAYCYHDYPEGARCMDSFCPPWKVSSCGGEGKLCRYGECIDDECAATNNCDDYPAGFVCDSGRCVPN